MFRYPAERVNATITTTLTEWSVDTHTNTHRLIRRHGEQVDRKDHPGELLRHQGASVAFVLVAPVFISPSSITRSTNKYLACLPPPPASFGKPSRLSCKKPERLTRPPRLARSSHAAPSRRIACCIRGPSSSTRFGSSPSAGSCGGTPIPACTSRNP